MNKIHLPSRNHDMVWPELIKNRGTFDLVEVKGQGQHVLMSLKIKWCMMFETYLLARHLHFGISEIA